MAVLGYGTYEIIESQIDCNGIKGTLTVPKSNTFDHVVLIIAGSGPTNRDGNSLYTQNNSLRLLAEHLALHNIAALRYDKRGVAQSWAEDFCEADLKFETLIDDAGYLLRHLKADKRFSKITVLGHSEGSLIAMLAAKQERVDSFISVAGISTFANLEIEQQILRSGMSEKLRQQGKETLDQLSAGVLVNDYPPELEVLFRHSVQPYLISWFAYNPCVEISTLAVPILIIQGTTDAQVTVESAEQLHQAAHNTTLSIIAGMNHILKNAPMDSKANIATYQQPSLPLNQIFLAEVVTFIKSQ